MNETGNNLTDHLFKLIDIEDNVLRDQEIANFLEAEKQMRSSSLDTSAFRLQFLFRQPQDKSPRSLTTLLAYAIKKHVSLDSLKLLTEAVLSIYCESEVLESSSEIEKEEVNKKNQQLIEMKQKIFMNALSYASSSGYLEAAEFFLAHTQVNIDGAFDNGVVWYEERISHPVHIALKTNNRDMIRTYLCYVHNFEITNGKTPLNYASFANSIPELEGYSATISAARALSNAQAAYYSNNTAKMFAAFSSACDADIDFVIKYLEHHLTICNENADADNEPLREYRHLLAFINIFNSIYTFSSSEKVDSSQADNPHLNEFRHNVVLSLLAHRCGTASSLFKDETTRSAYLANLLKGTEVAKRFSEMPGKDPQSPSNLLARTLEEQQQTEKKEHEDLSNLLNSNAPSLRSNITSILTAKQEDKTPSDKQDKEEDSSVKGLGNHPSGMFAIKPKRRHSFSGIGGQPDPTYDALLANPLSQMNI
ncbi:MULTISPECIES: hypothetical protein [Legionella]|uniref:Ankyrin repeat protein n=1 Tax=Legionella maceachernii TaxID=466 RepID=A0A0W0W4D2_9GAMM|nr:hypothetical protein [Legionella maceachernii]KTD27194.1 hypothetical protein Lmac_1442 [Legionella maceachernii]SKA13244.1 hypothetical protein SAMN02745128_02214 [Legionella maceachernii]SUP04750.1 Uncharacterised protein [Legionella maceachernii]